MGKIKLELLWGNGQAIFDNRSVEYNCINPECSESKKTNFDLEESAKRMVGVRKTEYIHPDKPSDVYAIMCECPKCFTNYWFHADEGFVKTFMGKREKSLKRKPKGAKK